MNTISQTHSFLAKPTGEERVSKRALGYVAQAAKDDLFDLVTRAYVESGISKATLAKRLGKDPAQITRLLGASGNWTLDTCAELLFAIRGSTLRFQEFWPLEGHASNACSPLCLISEPGEQISVTVYSELKEKFVISSSVKSRTKNTIVEKTVSYQRLCDA